MGCTVFAEGNGFFHKGSGGSGTAPLDVCLSPPPPPTGPVPVPYVNKVSASDLAKGSKSVLFDGGNPTAMEDVSEISTSSGDEGGTQGGGVVTHKTKGTGSFLLWSFIVKVEGKGACCHGHPIFQNGSSAPKNIVCAKAKVVKNLKKHGFAKGYKCTPCELAAFKRHAPTSEQRRRSNAEGRRTGCWSCPRVRNAGTRSDGTRFNRGQNWTPDHQPPQNYVWEKLGGCKGACGTKAEKKACRAKFKKWATAPDTCIPHCSTCSNSQGGYVGNHNGTEAMKKVMQALRK